MIKLNVCPSTLQEGFSTYSPTALKQLFDGHITLWCATKGESCCQ